MELDHIVISNIYISLWLMDYFRIHHHYFFNPSPPTMNYLWPQVLESVGRDLLDHGAQHLHVAEEEMDGVEGGDVSKVMQLVNDRFEILCQVS